MPARHAEKVPPPVAEAPPRPPLGLRLYAGYAGACGDSKEAEQCKRETDPNPDRHEHRPSRESVVRSSGKRDRCHEREDAGAPDDCNDEGAYEIIPQAVLGTAVRKTTRRERRQAAARARAEERRKPEPPA